MSTPRFATCQDEVPERSFWYRVGSSAVLVGAGIGWASALLACVLVGPVSLALGSGDEHRAAPHDDL
jgi:hypothetical protein